MKFALASSACILCGWLLVTICATADDKGAKQVADDDANDPYQWLEGVTDERALDWVRARNAKAEAKLESDPLYQPLYNDLLAILDSEESIPMVTKHGDYLYNFWKDKKNERGLWRRTT
ncbi:MAG: S9 family peptidase, partial [Aureliella sp.]